MISFISGLSCDNPEIVPVCSRDCHDIEKAIAKAKNAKQKVACATEAKREMEGGGTKHFYA